MKRLLLLVFTFTWSIASIAQSFEVSGFQDTQKGRLGELIRTPLRIKNISEKPITLSIKHTESQIGTSQKSIFCPENNCTDFTGDEFVVKLEPGQTLLNFSIGLEAGLAEGFSTIKILILNKSIPTESLALDLNFLVEAKPEKSNIYTSRQITIHDVYPNPASSVAYIDYTLHADPHKTKIVLHNILGSPIKEYELSAFESKVKLSVEDLNSGIYFYTLYINNEGVITRKLIVKK
jgi:hypothetical protein